MASIPCAINVHIAYPWSISSKPSSDKLRTPFFGLTWRIALRRPSPRTKRAAPAGHGGGAQCFFKFGSRGVDAKDAGIYGSQSRDDFNRDDVEQYFNYTGMLAVEGSYDKMNALLNQNIHPVDILLMLAASEGDKPKIEELLRAGANFDVKDVDGTTALHRAGDEIKEFIIGFCVQEA
ncbi:hypothetical protein HPP92_017028 [Vanilla planifolia]|uniref:Protein LHCP TRANSLOCATION DEFECT n=1 Tax=Vanilla planifolia TaxID=51239 RepID=A0A835QRG0_VANPL|nr:hypothetical protein HPP92_017028 [Vanilla planifolia]